MVTRLYDFTANTTIASAEVDAELNQILAALNSNVILTTGAQTKAGVLTLTSIPVLPASVPLTTPIVTQILGSGAGKVYPELKAGKVTCTAETSTTSGADVTGATVTLVPEVACTMIIAITADIGGTVAGDIAVVRLLVDTVVAGESATFQIPVDGYRATVGQTAVINLTAASHVIKLQLLRSSGSGTVTAYTTSTGFSYFLISQ